MSKFRDAWVRAAALLSILLPVFFLIAAFGTKYGLFDWRLGFQTLSLRIGPMLILIALVGGLIGLVLSAAVKPRRGWRLALFATFAPCVALIIAGGAVMQSRKAPPIHDVSTDLIDPPRFSPSIAAERALVRGSNSLDLKHERAPDNPMLGEAAGRLSTELQQAAFPDIQPIAVGAPKARALAAARGAALTLGWTIDRVDDQGGVIEARVESFWYGFVDDIVIRVTPVGPGSVIDVRSSSRVGVIDLGQNAERVRAFTKEVARELAKN
jgi:uncharacterized protein (DUF1499 family)